LDDRANVKTKLLNQARGKLVAGISNF